MFFSRRRLRTGPIHLATIRRVFRGCTIKDGKKYWADSALWPPGLRHGADPLSTLGSTGSRFVSLWRAWLEGSGSRGLLRQETCIGRGVLHRSAFTGTGFLLFSVLVVILEPPGSGGFSGWSGSSFGFYAMAKAIPTGTLILGVGYSPRGWFRHRAKVGRLLGTCIGSPDGGMAGCGSAVGVMAR